MTRLFIVGWVCVREFLAVSIALNIFSNVKVDDSEITTGTDNKKH